MKYGYARVSTKGQNLDRQTDILETLELDEIIYEKESAAKYPPLLYELLERVKEGDEIHVVSIIRIARSMKQLINILELIRIKKVDVITYDYGKIDTTTPMGEMFWQLIGMFAQFERQMIAARAKQGLESAALRGKRGGRPRVPLEVKYKVISEVESGLYDKSDIAKINGIGLSTLYKIMKEHKESIDK